MRAGEYRRGYLSLPLSLPCTFYNVEISEVSTSCPISLCPPPSPPEPPPPIACFNLWTLDPVLFCSRPPARPRLWLMSVQQSVFSSFWFEGKEGDGEWGGVRRSLRNRFSNAIGGGCQRGGVAGEPFMPFHLKKPKGSWRVHSACVPLALLMGSAPPQAAPYRSPAFYFTSRARAKKPSSDLKWKKKVPDGFLALFLPLFSLLLFCNVKMT